MPVGADCTALGHTSRGFLVELPGWLSLGGTHGWCHGEKGHPSLDTAAWSACGRERRGEEERVPKRR